MLIGTIAFYFLQVRTRLIDVKSVYSYNALNIYANKHSGLVSYLTQYRYTGRVRWADIFFLFCTGVEGDRELLMPTT